MHKRTSGTHPNLKKLRENISPKQFQNMMILGLNITLDQVDSDNMKDRVIIFLNNSLVNSRKEFEGLLKDFIKYEQLQEKLKARIMSKMDDYKKIDPEIFKILDEAS